MGIGVIGGLLTLTVLTLVALVKRFGIGRAMVGVAVLIGLASLLLPAAGGPLVVLVPILVAAWLLRGLALPVFNITLASLRQAMTPDALQGRVNATSRVLAGAAAPVGALLGGVLGDGIGLRARPRSFRSARRAAPDPLRSFDHRRFGGTHRDTVSF